VITKKKTTSTSKNKTKMTTKKQQQKNNKSSPAHSKVFTNVTKTRANLSKYSGRLGNYNGTIVFEIDIMRKSSPINLKFTFLPLSKPNWHFFSGAVS